MNLAELKARGGFVSGALVKKEVSWTHMDPVSGDQITDTFTIHVRRLAYGDIERIFLGGEDGERSRSAAVIAARVLLGEKADERLSYEEAFQLEPSLAAALTDAIAKVPETAPKN